MHVPEATFTGWGRLGALALVFVAGVLFNYPWELAQAPLYEGMGDFRAMLWHCFVATLGDGVILLGITAAGWAVFGDLLWFERPSWPGYALMLLVGGAIAIAVELVALHLLGRWAYSSLMPIVPGLGVGLAPLAQMLLLPPLIFATAASVHRWMHRSAKHRPVDSAEHGD